MDIVRFFGGRKKFSTQILMKTPFITLLVATAASFSPSSAIAQNFDFQTPIKMSSQTAGSSFSYYENFTLPTQIIGSVELILPTNISSGSMVWMYSIGDRITNIDPTKDRSKLVWEVPVAASSVFSLGSGYLEAITGIYPTELVAVNVGTITPAEFLNLHSGEIMGLEIMYGSMAKELPDGATVILRGTFASPVPESSTWALMGFGLVVVAFFARKRV